MPRGNWLPLHRGAKRTETAIEGLPCGISAPPPPVHGPAGNWGNPIKMVPLRSWAPWAWRCGLSTRSPTATMLAGEGKQGRGGGREELCCLFPPWSLLPYRKSNGHHGSLGSRLEEIDPHHPMMRGGSWDEGSPLCWRHKLLHQRKDRDRCQGTQRVLC